jgi:predicted RNase H-like HicB family nuclease
MSKIYYPVIFHSEEAGYSARVPDLDGCFTQGDTIMDTLKMIRNAIGLYLDGKTDYPNPSSPKSLKLENGDFMMVVDFDPAVYQKKYSNRSVKKSLTIPAWLNTAAEEAHLNFSHILQDALKKELGID